MQSFLRSLRLPERSRLVKNWEFGSRKNILEYPFLPLFLEATLDSSRNSNTEDVNQSELREASTRNDSLLEDLRLVKAMINSGKI